MNNDTVTAADVMHALSLAREILDRQPELAKGQPFTWTAGRPCLSIHAAIVFASPNPRVRDAVSEATLRALQGQFQGRRIEDFNDHQHTTVSDAQTLLQRAKANALAVAAVDAEPIWIPARSSATPPHRAPWHRPTHLSDVPWSSPDCEWKDRRSG